MDYLKNIIIGNINIDTKPDLFFPSLKLEINNKTIEISGNVKHLWKNQDCVQTLVLTTSNSSGSQNNIKLSKYVFEPFLFYLLLLCGEENNIYNINSSEFIKDSNFIINISYNTKSDKLFEPFIYKIEKNTALNYLKNLINDFLFSKDYDLLPFEIFSDLIKNNIIDEKQLSKNDIEEKIENKTDFNFLDINRSHIIDIVNPVIPEKPFDIIKSRFELLYGFVKGSNDD
jgi:hypothetical protein